jgi:hypothetical protein
LRVAPLVGVTPACGWMFEQKLPAGDLAALLHVLADFITIALGVSAAIVVVALLADLLFGSEHQERADVRDDRRCRRLAFGLELALTL